MIVPVLAVFCALDLAVSGALSFFSSSILAFTLSVLRVAITLASTLLARRIGSSISSGAKHLAFASQKPEQSGDDEQELEGQPAESVLLSDHPQSDHLQQDNDVKVVLRAQRISIVCVFVSAVATSVALAVSMSTTLSLAASTGVLLLFVILLCFAELVVARLLLLKLTSDPGLKLPSHGHPCFLVTESYMGHCDMCENSFEASGRYNCAPCWFDICLSCAKKDLRQGKRPMTLSALPPLSFGRKIFFAWNYLLKSRIWLLLLAALLVLIGQVLSSAIPFVTGRVFDAIVGQQVDQFKQWIMVLGAIAACSALIVAVSSFVFTWTRGMIEQDLKANMFRRLLSQPFAFFDREKTGDLMSRLDNDTERLAQPISNSMRTVVSSLLSITLALSMCAYTSFQLTVLALCVLAPVALVRYWYR